MDEKFIQEPFQEFERRPYQRQKSALEQQLSTFLASVSPPKTISSCTVDDVIKFLIYKDSSGRTVVHVPTCSGGACACPRCLAAVTGDSLLGKLRSIFNKLGRIDHSNPIAHPRIKEYLNFVRVEQAGMAGAFWGQSSSCSVVSRVEAVSSHNLVYRDVVIGMQ